MSGATGRLGRRAAKEAASAGAGELCRILHKIAGMSAVHAAFARQRCMASDVLERHSLPGALAHPGVCLTSGVTMADAEAAVKKSPFARLLGGAAKKAEASAPEQVPHEFSSSPFGPRMTLNSHPQNMVPLGVVWFFGCAAPIPPFGKMHYAWQAELKISPLTVCVQNFLSR